MKRYSVYAIYFSFVTVWALSGVSYSHLSDAERISPTFSAGCWTQPKIRCREGFVMPILTLRIDSVRQHASFTVTGISSYTQISYELTYGTASGTKGAKGEHILSGENEFSRSDIFLGSCTSGGTCTPDPDVKNLNVTVTLTHTSGETLTVSRHID